MSDHDLIRRGDVAKAITALAQEFIDGGSPTAANVLNLASDRITALPAVSVGVTPEVAALEAARAERAKAVDRAIATLAEIKGK